MPTILLKRSNLAGNIPAANELQEGELGLNTSDLKLFTKNNLGTIIDLFYNNREFRQAAINTYSTQVVNSANNSEIDTGLSVTLTPTKQNATILILAIQNGCGKAGGNLTGSLKLYRNTILLTEFSSNFGYTANNNTNIIGNQTCVFLDSPNTLNPITYKTRLFTSVLGGSGNVYAQYSNSSSTIIAIEIAG